MSNVPDESLKTAYRNYLRSLQPASRQKCPPTADLIRFFSARTARRFKARLLDHVAGCGACADEFETLMVMDRETRAFTEEAGRPQSETGPAKVHKTSRGFLGAGRWLLVCAGLAVVGFILIRQPAGPVNSEEFGGALRSAAAATFVPEAPVGRVDAANPVIFRWRFSGNEEASPACVVFLYDDSLLQIWRSGQEDSLERALPGAVQKSLVSGRAYFWAVSAGPDSSCLESALVPFSVVRRPSRGRERRSASPEIQ